MSENISVQDFEIFKEAMIEENLAMQINIIRKLELLAKALGEKSTREELLPFIQANLDLHDEILLNLSDHLKHFIPLVGGFEYSKIVFDILAKICNTDENLVREKAVETLIFIGQGLDRQQTEDLLLPVLNKLISDDWFTSKCSAVMLYSTLYPKLSDEKKIELRSSFKTLIQDDSPMVRKAAALACADFVASVEHDVVKNDLIPIFCDIAQDPMDSVKSVTIDIALALSKRLIGNEIEESIIKALENASDDPSWRIRQRLASSIATLQQRIPFGKYRGKLIGLFQKLTKDMEAEVRIIATANLFSYCRYLLDSYLSEPKCENNFEPVFEQSIWPVIKRLAVDENEDVRLALSSNVLALSSIISEKCSKKYIVPLLLEILDHEESIAIQANFLQAVSNLSSNVDLTQSLNAVTNAIRIIIARSQSNWRTRRSLLTIFVDVSKFCSDEYFSNHFKIYYTALLGDAVFAVRRSASLILPLLVKHYGIKWASENLISYFTMFTRDSRYLCRYVPLFGIREMINPFLCSKTNSYLKDFKIAMEEKESPIHKKALLALARIVRLFRSIEKKLQEEKYAKMLRLRNKIDYPSSFDVAIYTETAFNALREKYKNVNVYSVDRPDFEENRWPYLQGILVLIYNKFLPIVASLNEDVTENIQICAIHTLGEISDFIGRLNKDIGEPWVGDNLNTLTPEERSVNEYEFKIQMIEEYSENIDTDLTETPEELDLSKTICIENSARLFASDKIENQIVDQASDSSLIKLVLDPLNSEFSDDCLKELSK